MRVLFILPNLKAYRDRFALLQEISRHCEKFILLVGTVDIPLEQREETMELIEIGFIPGKRWQNLKKAHKLASQKIEEEKIQIVHDTFSNLWLLFKQKKQYPHLRFFHSLFILQGYRLRHIWNKKSFLQKWFNKKTLMVYYGAWMEKMMCSLADRVVLQAPGLIPHIQEYLPQLQGEDLVVLNNNVDHRFWKPPESLRWKEKASIELFNVGSVDPSRGIFTLLETFKRLKDNHHLFRIDMAGGWGPFCQKEVLSKISQFQLEKEIHFIGKIEREEVRNFHHEKDLFIYLSQNDGSPRSVLEALATGIPIIASPHPGIEALDPEKKIIHFVPFGCSDSLYEAILEYKDNKDAWRQRALEGSHWIRENFSMEKIAGDYLREYQRSLG